MNNHGPFDIIGDIHGCLDELLALLAKLGYAVDPRTYAVTPPPGRTAIFLGDLIDRGPGITGVLRLVMGMVDTGQALCLLGNHDAKLARKLQGRNVKIAHGLAETLEQLDAEPPEFRERVARFLSERPDHLVLDDGRLVVAHAGLPERMHGRSGPAVRSFALYGDVTGETDEWGMPIRRNWAEHYRGAAAVIYGHTPVPEPEWINGTINIDTGSVFGGRLTALRWPEQELVSVPAGREYAVASRPFRPVPEPAYALPGPELADHHHLEDQGDGQYGHGAHA